MKVLYSPKFPRVLRKPGVKINSNQSKAISARLTPLCISVYIVEGREGGLPFFPRRRLAWPNTTRNHGAMNPAAIKVEIGREAANPDRLTLVLRN